MKVAILLAGQPRFVDSISYDIIKHNIINKYDCDVYCHCWYGKDEMLTAPWSGLKSFTCKGNELELIRTLYKPIGFEYDAPLNKQDVITFHKTSSSTTNYNLSSYYKSIQRVYEVYEKYKPADTEYDIFIRLRYDALPTVIPDLFNLEKGYVYFSDHHGARHCFANNMIIITDKYICKIICNAYYKIEEYNNSGLPMNDEEYTFNHIQKHNINYRLLPFHQFRCMLPSEIDFKMYI